MDQSCKKCIYFDVDICRRRCPQLTIWEWRTKNNDPRNTAKLIWPEVKPDDWCGEWSDGSCEFCGAKGEKNG